MNKCHLIANIIIIVRMPLATLEKELCLSRREVETLIEAINSTMEESKKIERDLISIQVAKILN